jgi:hypothetical protein
VSRLTPDIVAVIGAITLALGFAAIWWPLGLVALGVIMLAAAVLWAANNVRARGPEA